MSSYFDVNEHTNFPWVREKLGCGESSGQYPGHQSTISNPDNCRSSAASKSFTLANRSSAVEVKELVSSR